MQVLNNYTDFQTAQELERFLDTHPYGIGNYPQGYADKVFVDWTKNSVEWIETWSARPEDAF